MLSQHPNSSNRFHTCGIWAGPPSNADFIQLPPHRPLCAASIQPNLSAGKPARTLIMQAHRSWASIAALALLLVLAAPHAAQADDDWHNAYPDGGCVALQRQMGQIMRCVPNPAYDTTHKQGDRSLPPGAGWRWCCRGSAQGTGACGSSVGVEPA